MQNSKVLHQRVGQTGRSADAPIAVTTNGWQRDCMKLTLCICAALILVAGCAPKTGVNLAPDRVSVGRWTPFYTRKHEDGRLDYFYDQSRLYRSGGHVVARWKVLASPDATTTLYVVDISCRDNTFNEKGTVIFDVQGHARKLPQSELFVGRPIESGTSSDVFRRKFCGL